MSHQLDLDGVFEKLVILQHFSNGSRKYCYERLAGSEQDAGNAELDEYWGWVKGITSSYLLECAIRLRILFDTISSDESIAKINALDLSARSDLDIALILEGNFEVTLRETCNKIIHARNVRPTWQAESFQGSEFQYWSGGLELAGKKASKDPWRPPKTGQLWPPENRPADLI